MFRRCIFLFAGCATYAAASGLTLDETQELAVARQPLLLSQQAAIQAAEQSAVAASQLPDPKLRVGLRDYPVTGSDAFSLTRENFTMLTLGISQDFPREAKRQLRGQRGEIESTQRQAELGALRRTIRRDAALAWLDAYQAEETLRFIRALQNESALKIDSLEIGLKTGRVSLADLLAERVNLQLLKDREADFANQAERARAALTRWIGAEAFRPLESRLPEAPAFALEQILAQVVEHPHLNTLEEQVRLAETEVALARQAYKPDWSLELSYGLRPEFSDFIGVQASIDLPVFPKNRQDRELAAKIALAERARALRDDQLRVMQADARRYFADWQSASGRLAELYEPAILPRARERADAALAAYRAGRSELKEVLESRRAEHELQLQQLALQVDRARAAQQLKWFID
jgi:cobalt-zinc-cadmium efflux system outer membrane protein